MPKLKDEKTARKTEKTRFKSTTSKRKKNRVAKKRAEPVFFRRCHHCGATNEHNTEILNCGHCDKKLSQFYYFDLDHIRPATDDQLRDESYDSEYRPIRGIALRW